MIVVALMCDDARSLEVSTVLTLEQGLYLRVEQLAGGPLPLPLSSGFSIDVAYRALGMFNPSETSDAYFIFSNDRDEIWFICNRHLRTVGLIERPMDLRLPLARAAAWVRAFQIAEGTAAA